MVKSLIPGNKLVSGKARIQTQYSLGLESELLASFKSAPLPQSLEMYLCCLSLCSSFSIAQIERVSFCRIHQ